MHEAGKFEPLNVAEIDGRWHYASQVPAIWHNQKIGAQSPNTPILNQARLPPILSNQEMH